MNTQNEVPLRFRTEKYLDTFSLVTAQNLCGRHCLLFSFLRKLVCNFWTQPPPNKQDKGGKHDAKRHQRPLTCDGLDEDVLLRVNVVLVFTNQHPVVNAAKCACSGGNSFITVPFSFCSSNLGQEHNRRPEECSDEAQHVDFLGMHFAASLEG